MTYFNKSTLKLISFSTPICMIGLLNMFASFIAILFVAKIGKEELAAAALASTSFITITTISATSLYSIGILVAGANGNKQLINAIVRNGIYSALFLGLISNIMLRYIPIILDLFHQDPKLISLTADYFNFASLSVIPSLLTMVLSQYYIGIGKSKATSQ